MNKIYSYTKGSRLFCFLAPLLKMTEAVSELIVPLVMASMIDYGILKNDKHYIFLLGLQLLIIGIIGFILSVCAQYFAAHASVNIVKRVRFVAFEKSQRISFSQLDSNGIPTIITRLTTDLDAVQNGINLTLRLLLRSPFVVIGACIMAYTVNHGSISIFLTVVIVLSVIIAIIIGVTMPLNKKVRGNLDKTLSSVRDTVTGARVIRALNREKEEQKQFNIYNENLFTSQIFTGRINSLLNPLTLITVNFGIAVIIYSGAVNVSKGEISTGAIVALYNYMGQILVELVKFANLIISVSKALACGSRVKDFLETEEPVYTDSAPEESENIITFDNVSFRYENSSEDTLSNINFTIKRGYKVGIVGSTGSGKTTLINLITGAYKPTEGKVITNGKNTAGCSCNDILKNIAVVEQNPTIFKGNIKNNITLGNKCDDDYTVEEALKSAMAYEFVTALEDGIYSETESRGKNFSGGQKQRLAIARALYKNTDILILDDSYSSLDLLTEYEVRNKINSSGNKTIITVSQRTGSITDCDCIIVLDNGKAMCGTHNELLKISSVYREIHFSQFDQEVNLHEK